MIIDNIQDGGKYKANKNTHHKFDYVIYHRQCLDGFTGFILLTMTNTITKNALIFPDMPSAKEAPPNIDDKNIIIIDVAYKKEVLSEIFERAKSVVFIDHHISINEDVKELVKKYNQHEIVYDKYRSGASLTWLYFNNTESLPRFIRYIEDNDIGKWEIEETIPFINGLEVYYKLDPTEKNINSWKKLIFNNSKIEKLIKKGYIFETYKEYLLDINSKKYSLELFPSQQVYEEFPNVFQRPEQYKVAVYCGNGCPSTSLIGKRLVEKVDCDFAIIWTFHMDKKEYVLSFRSDKVNVGEIAKAFGGGGHELASACGFSNTKYNITDLFGKISLPRASKK